MSRILVTGSHGFIGTHLVQRLWSLGHLVYGLDLGHHPNEYAATVDGDPRRVRYCRADISDRWQLERALDLSQPECVYHLAAEFGRHNGEVFVPQLWATNVIGTRYLLDAQARQGFRLIHFSSSEVYGDHPGPMTEDVMDLHEVRQLSDYALSKWVSECQVRNAIRQWQTQSVIIRPFNVFGPGEHYSPYRSALCRFIYAALHGLPLTVYRGHQRSWLYIDDAVQTLVHLPDHFTSGQAYNLGSPVSVTMEALAALVCTITQRPQSQIIMAAHEPMTTRAKQVDLWKAEHELGHDVRVSLEEGIARTAAWMRRTYGV